MLRKYTMDNPANHQPVSEQKTAMSVGIAILIGQMVVNLPVLIVLLITTVVGITRTRILMEMLPPPPELVIYLGLIGSILIGALAGWLWWSFSISRWQKWALKNGTSEDELQKWAILTGLIWPQGSASGKTDF